MCASRGGLIGGRNAHGEADAYGVRGGLGSIGLVPLLAVRFLETWPRISRRLARRAQGRRAERRLGKFFRSARVASSCMVGNGATGAGAGGGGGKPKQGGARGKENKKDVRLQHLEST